MRHEKFCLCSRRVNAYGQLMAVIETMEELLSSKGRAVVALCLEACLFFAISGLSIFPWKLTLTGAAFWSFVFSGVYNSRFGFWPTFFALFASSASGLLWYRILENSGKWKITDRASGKILFVTGSGERIWNYRSEMEKDFQEKQDSFTPPIEWRFCKGIATTLYRQELDHNPRVSMEKSKTDISQTGGTIIGIIILIVVILLFGDSGNPF